MVDWGLCLPWVYVHSSICETYSSVDVFQRSMVSWGIYMPCVYVHSSICDTDSV